MNTINLGVYGIIITHCPNDIKGCAIVSEMKEPEDVLDNAEFNAGVDGLESLILAHFGAGIDIKSPEYIEGIETAYTALGAHYS
ncbi:hypothetical protein AB4254_08250 [Vibrio breoganii]